KKISIYLDDDLQYRKTPKGFLRTTNYKDMIETLNKYKGNIHTISLDNDLGEITEGYDVVKYMVEQNIWREIIYIHSKNPVAKENMYQLICRYKPEDTKVYKIF